MKLDKDLITLPFIKKILSENKTKIKGLTILSNR